MSISREPAKDCLNRLFAYKDGQLFNKTDRKRSRKGSKAGTQTKRGYVAITITQRKYYIHRIIWVMHNGPIPDDMEIDHIDRIRNNNRIENLRIVSHAEQMKNTGVKKSNTSGVAGVFYNKHVKKWSASINHKGKSKYLGIYLDKSDAVSARQEAEIQYGYKIESVL